MEKTKKKTSTAKNTTSEEELRQIQQMRVFGFESSMQVARELMGSIHENLLRGDLVFAYRSNSSSNKTPLFQVVVVNDLRQGTDGNIYSTDKFSISIITSGYTAYLPHMPIEYLGEVEKDLVEGKAEQKIIENFKLIVEDFKTKIKGGKV